MEVPEGAGAFSVAGVPVVLRPARELRAVLTLAEGAQEEVPDAVLTVERTAALFERRGEARRIDVFAPFPK